MFSTKYWFISLIASHANSCALVRCCHRISDEINIVHTNHEKSGHDRYAFHNYSVNMRYIVVIYMSRITFYVPFLQGIFQLINKTDGHPFDENDENLFEVYYSMLSLSSWFISLERLSFVLFFNVLFYRRLQYSVGLEFTIQTCTRKHLSCWQNKWLQWRWDVVHCTIVVDENNKISPAVARFICSLWFFVARFYPTMLEQHQKTFKDWW